MTKIKEIELIFRKLLIQSHLGNSQITQVPYCSVKLPLEKITRICQENLQNVQVYNLRTIRNNPFWNVFLEQTASALKSLRFSHLKEENMNLEENHNENNEEVNDGSPNGSDSERTELGSEEEDL